MDPSTEFLWRTGLTAFLAVLSAVISFLVTLVLRSRYERRLGERLRRQAEQYARQHGSKEAALFVSVVNDVREAALAYLGKDGRSDMPVFAVHRKEGFGDGEGQWLGVLEDVKKEIRKIRDGGYQRVHVFISGPVALAVMVGATLTNGPEAVVYHFTSGHYKSVGRLTVEAIRL